MKSCFTIQSPVTCSDSKIFFSKRYIGIPQGGSAPLDPPLLRRAFWHCVGHHYYPCHSLISKNDNLSLSWRGVRDRLVVKSKQKQISERSAKISVSFSAQRSALRHPIRVLFSAYQREHFKVSIGIKIFMKKGFFNWENWKRKKRPFCWYLQISPFFFFNFLH